MPFPPGFLHVPTLSRCQGRTIPFLFTNSQIFQEFSISILFPSLEFNLAEPCMKEIVHNIYKYSENTLIYNKNDVAIWRGRPIVPIQLVRTFTSKKKSLCLFWKKKGITLTLCLLSTVYLHSSKKKIKTLVVFQHQFN